MTTPRPHPLTTPRAAALAGVLVRSAVRYRAGFDPYRAARRRRGGRAVAGLRQPPNEDRGDPDAVRGHRIPVVHRGGARRFRPPRGQVFLVGVHRRRADCFWRWCSCRRPSVPVWWRAAGMSWTYPRIPRWPPSGRWCLITLTKTYALRMARRVHDLAGHHLAEDRSDATLVGHRDLCSGTGDSARERYQYVDHTGVSGMGARRQLCCCWSRAGVIDLDRDD